MNDRLTALEDRVARLECELAELRNGRPAAEDAAANDPLRDFPYFAKKLPREVALMHDEYIQKALGIEHLRPVGAERLRAMMIAEGIDPNGTEFSRGIVEMREE